MAMRVVIAASEAVPFAKTGGLADVAGSLPLALKKLGCKVALFLPYYRQVASIEPAPRRTGIVVSVPVGRRAVRAEVLKGFTDGEDVYFIRCDEFFDRTYLYGTPEGDYFDNLERYSFFSRGVLEAMKALHLKTDVIHCHDWQTALIPAYLKDAYLHDPFFAKTSTVFTVHNIAYQGLFGANMFDATGLSPNVFTPEGVEFWGRVNLMKAGLVYSDIITTVSRAYSREIQTPEYGAGLDGILKRRKRDLYGVLNGVDYDEWNPETDTLISANYSSSDLSGKEECKHELLERFGLKLRRGRPLIGVLSRLAAQKGFDILAAAMPALAKLGLGIVVLGSGERGLQQMLKGLQARYPAKLSVKIAFDVTLAHRLEAGCDMLLMPSRYEPCGLNQIYSMRYGTVPIVRATGGLDDTVRDYTSSPARGNGFKFKEYTHAALVGKVKEATALYRDTSAWTRLVKKTMKERFTWERSARQYIELYRLAGKRRA